MSSRTESGGSEAALVELARAVEASGLVPADSRGVALVSGGADSTGLAAGLRELIGPDRLTLLHLNYGLREGSDSDQRTCEELAAELGVPIEVAAVEVDPGAGNLQAAAREARYAEAEGLRAEIDADWVATGHTLTDLAETVLYRLASSPGVRPLLALPARRGSLVRPLLDLSRERVRSLVEAAGLPFADDPTNAEPLFARNRIRNEVLPVLDEIAPAIEQTIAETRAELAEDLAALESLAAEALEAAGAGSGPSASAEALAAYPAAVRRIALRMLAERVAGAPLAVGRERARRVWELADKPEGGVVELGQGIEARLEQGFIRIARSGAADLADATLAVPGSCRFGDWDVRAEVAPPPAGEGSAAAEVALLDPDALGGDPLVVRSWRDGDRMRPQGRGGSRSLADLFGEQRVPRSLRRSLPVVTSAGRIAWVAGLAVDEGMAAPAGSDRVAVLTARLVAGDGA